MRNCTLNAEAFSKVEAALSELGFKQVEPEPASPAKSDFNSKRQSLGSQIPVQIPKAVRPIIESTVATTSTKSHSHIEDFTNARKAGLEQSRQQSHR